MKTKQWESSEDRRNESDVARALEHRWACRLHKLPKSYRLDYLCTRRGVAVAWVEVKCRTHSSDRYDTLMLSLSKQLAARELTQQTGLPSCLVVRFTDDIYFAPFSRDYAITMGGRTAKTRDTRDLEPVIQIPIKEMERLYETVTD